MIQEAQNKINYEPQIFTVWSDEIQGRINPYFYKAEFREIEKVLSKKKTIKFSELINSVSMGASIPKYKEEKNEVPFIFGKNVKHGVLDLSDLEYISKKTSKRFKSSILEEKDLVFSVRGAYIGKVAVIPKKIEGGNIINNLVRINLKNKNLAEYLTIYLSSKIGQSLIDREVWGGAQPGITNEQIKNLKIPLPSLSVQNKIVSIMQKVFEEKKEKETEASKLLESIDNYVLDELGIKSPEIKREMVFEVMSDKVENNRVDAEYWQPFLEEIEQIINKGKYKTQKLKNFITKIHYGASTSNAYVDGGIPFLRILDLKPNHIDLSDVVYLPDDFRKELGNAFVRAGDLLISRSGTVGVVSVVPKEADGFAFGSFMIKFCLNDEANKEFISIWLNNKLNKLLTEREKIGAIQGNITIGTIENFDIPLPSLIIQNKIVEKIKSCYSQAQKLKDEANNNLQKTKEKVEQIILG